MHSILTNLVIMLGRKLFLAHLVRLSGLENIFEASSSWKICPITSWTATWCSCPDIEHIYGIVIHPGIYVITWRSELIGKEHWPQLSWGKTPFPYNMKCTTAPKSVWHENEPWKEESGASEEMTALVVPFEKAAMHHARLSNVSPRQGKGR